MNIKERTIKQIKSVDLLYQESEFLQELEKFKQRHAKTTNRHYESINEPAQIEDQLSQELQNERYMMAHFVELLRKFPHMPLKPTTNTGGETPLELDFQGIYEFFEVKVRNALRLDEENTLQEADQARNLGIDILNTYGGLNLLSQAREVIVVLPDEVSPNTVRNMIYAERLATESRKLGIDIPTYEEFLTAEEN